MRRSAELAVKGLVRSRWGLALVIAVVVLAVVALGRVFAGPRTDQVLVDADPPAPVVASTEAHGDDSVILPSTAPTPRTSPGTAKPEAVAYAFASAWVDHRKVTADAWHDRMLPHATHDLAKRLSGVDPASVPADRIIGRPSIVTLSADVLEAVVTVDSGQLRLRLVAPDGPWLVDGVDWERA